jgi:hypothetical protein
MDAEWTQGQMNDYCHACGCGLTTTVSISDAGSLIRCGCGRESKVPSLGRLRELTGKDRYESGVVDQIRRMIRNGEIPSADTCALSKRTTSDTVTASIVIPRFFKNEDKDDWMLALMAGWVALLLVKAFRKTAFEDEGTITLEVPLRVAASWQGKARGLNQKRLKKALQTEPMYSRLLKENPHCRVTILGQS